MQKNSVQYYLIMRNTGHNWHLLPTYRNAFHGLFIVQRKNSLVRLQLQLKFRLQVSFSYPKHIA